MYPMHLAAREGHVEVIETIVDSATYGKLKDAKRRLTDYNGFLPIHWGAIKGHVEVIRRLDADINAVNAQNYTPLHLAVLHDNVGVVEELLKLSVDMEKTNNDGDTALLLALGKGKLEIAKRLIEEGANTTCNPFNSDRETPLHYLIRGSWENESSVDVSELPKVADALIKKGVDPWAKNKEDQTPADLAAELEFVELQGYLNTLSQSLRRRA
jgi:ankyrin repeat protein